MKVEEEIKIVREIVENYLDLNAERAGIGHLILDSEAKQHIINIGFTGDM